MFDLVVLLISTVTMSVLGLLVVSRNIKNITFRLFGFMTFASIAWSLANYFTNHMQGYNTQLFVNRLSLFVGFLLIQAVWLLSLYFPHKINEHIWQRRVSAVLTPIFLFITLFTPGIVSSVVYRPEKNITDINVGNAYYFYVFMALLVFTFLVFNFYKSYTSKMLNRVQRQQVLYAAIGLLLSFVWAIATAALIPSLTDNWEISKYGAVGTWFLVAFVSYSIVRHKLFDIRLVVARTVGYLLSLAALATVYSIVIFVVLILSVGLDDIDVSQTLIYVFLAVFLSFSFQPIKHFFDRISNTLFYQDAYDLQQFLNEFNTLLVSTIDLSKILKDSVNTVQKYIKPDYVIIYINKVRGVDSKIASSTSNELEKNIDNLRHTFDNVKQQLIVTDELSDQTTDYSTKLNNHNISVVAKIISSDAHGEAFGYLILGPKKSGSIYNKQDIRALEIISHELVIATQNALRFEEIQQFNLTLQQKVDDATRKLRATNEKLKALDETKDEFISMASHQLRTPLTSVKGYVSMVLEGDSGKISAMQRKLLDQAFISSQRMVYLIADLLNVSRLKTGKFIIDASPTNLADVIEGEIGQLVETAKSRQLELTYKKPDSFPSLTLDETKIRQVIMNFIDNAIYYTPSGGHIVVSLVDKPDSIEFTVTDDGIGVPKAEQHHLFNKFYRAGNAKKARPDGTGLGLFMAKKVIVAQGGAVIFHTQEGRGSTFGFTFGKAQLKILAQHKLSTVSTPETAKAANLS